MRVIAFILAALLLATGCNSDPEPKEPKTTPTAKPTLTAPTLPPEAKADSEAGAIAFVKHYIDVFNYASNTGDVQQLQKLSDPECEGCTSYIETIESTHSGGGAIRGFEWRIDDIEPDSNRVFGLQISSAEYQTKASDSTDWKVVLSATYELLAQISEKGPQRQVADLYLPGQDAS